MIGLDATAPTRRSAIPLISLDQLTVVGVSPIELVDIAADAGYDAVSPFTGGSDRLPAHKLTIGDGPTEAMVVRLRERGIGVRNLDGMVIKSRMDWDESARLLDVAVHIGAQRGASVVFDRDRTRATDSLCRLAEMAASRDLGLVVEFSRLTEIGSLNEAVGFVGAATHPVGVLVDLMHLIQSGETPADIARYDPAVIAAAQLCDSRAALTRDEYMRDAFEQREVPGDGELPVRAFLRALPEHTPVGIEVPLRSMAAQGVSHLDRARLLLDRTRALLDETTQDIA